MLKEVDIEELLNKAHLEEKAANWVEAAKLYEIVATFYFNNNLLDKAAETYKILGECYLLASETAETAEDYRELSIRGIKTCKEAANLFKKIGRESDELECKASAFYLEHQIAESYIKLKNSLKNSYQLFIKASELFSLKNNKEDYARTLARALISLNFHTYYYSDNDEFMEIFRKFLDIGPKAWKISRDVRSFKSLAEALIGEIQIIITYTYGRDFKEDEFFKEYIKDMLLRGEESLTLVEGSGDYRALAFIYIVTSGIYHYFGKNFVDDEKEQRKYFDKSIIHAEKGLENARKSKVKFAIMLALFFLDWTPLLMGRFDYLQKRVINDLNELAELGKIFADSLHIFRYTPYFVQAIYYSNIAQMSFFTPTQRETYAKKGIQYGLEMLKKCYYEPFIAWSYQALTWSYSQLALLTTIKDERIDHTKKMLDYAKDASKMAEKYEGGFIRAAGYGSLYKAYKTMADLAESKVERIKMLSIAADASKNYINHTIESRTGIIAAQMRFGLLLEELGILTMKTDTLIEAKELLIDVVDEGLKRGYHSYAAASCEYVARIEDRLGDHTASAHYYEKAQNAYAKSLKNIGYKLLKKRVKEKMDYVKVWSLIESAKTFHKRENHSKARENYINAYEILKKLRNFNYEASYYNAWASQEEAEQLSKLEKHEKAIEQYEKTKTAFNDAIKSMQEISKRVKDKFALERIGKLTKVANLRIKYCSARLNVEKARILGKQGKHCAAAELFASAASEFRYVCTLFKIERERVELEAVYFLCRAWETMELAEKYEEPERFAEAANLFVKASKLFLDSKLKLLAAANAAFCQALESGCKFDETPEMKVKTELYFKVRANLRKAATTYRKGGFLSGADWALATSTYFDATWHLIKADEELDLNQRKELLEVGSDYLKSAAELFEKAGNIQKKKEVLERLDLVAKEEKIIISALNSIKKPTLSSSMVGIVAPDCSLEISQSPRLGEIRQLMEEERRVVEERGVKKKYEIVYRDLFKVYIRPQKGECRVGVAQIGVSQTGNILNEFYETKASGIIGLREDKVEIVRDKVKTMIENAHENGVHILLFPEMTIDLNHSVLLEGISDLAKQYEMYIIPGSYHDQQTRKNISVVFGPDGILWEQEKHIPATIQFGKKRFKEAIEVGSLPRKTIVCNTEYGRIAIAICRDFLDMDLRVEFKNFEPPVDIILNPAFTPVTADFKAAHFDARRSIYAYCFFANMAEFGDSFIHTPEKERVERNIPPKEEGLIYKDVDLFKLRSERKKWERMKKKETMFIQSTR
jgi:predicted amidohydrolase